MSYYQSILTINRLRLSVNLGAGEAERAKPQPLEVDIRLYFSKAPACTQDDSRNDFICYDQICTAIVEYTAKSEFRLIEYLATQLHALVRQDLNRQVGQAESESVKIWLRLHKCIPPVPYMLGGAEYIISDLPADAQRIEAA